MAMCVVSDFGGPGPARTGIGLTLLENGPQLVSDRSAGTGGRRAARNPEHGEYAWYGKGK